MDSVTSQPKQPSLLDRIFDESKSKDGTAALEAFTKNVDNELITEGNTDVLLSKTAQNLIQEIATTKSGTKIQEFF